MKSVSLNAQCFLIAINLVTQDEFVNIIAETIQMPYIEVLNLSNQVMFHTAGIASVILLLLPAHLLGGLL